ncbi:hypothetical protein ACIQM4_29335 [Streptomyces sp. NPDC091272]|uniref:hypothetical protein n=1 Tax=Streptomyces sp. NPDC091272 TaxID=3365981 RepID=UPI0038117612
MVLHGDVSTHVRGPSRRSLAIAAVVTVAVLAAATLALVSHFNDRPVWSQNVAYEAGYYRGQQIRKTDRTGEAVAEAVSGGCARSVATAGKKADVAPDSWVRGCLDAAHGRPSTPNSA